MVRVNAASPASEISTPPKRYSLLTFFLLAFVLSWAIWVPVALASRGLLSFPISPTFPLAAFGPSITALLLTTFTEGFPGLRRLLGRFLIWRVGLRWYAFVLLYPAAVSLTTTAGYALFGGRAPNFGDPPVLSIYPLPPELREAGPLVLLPFVFLITLLLSSPMGEEIGWRGYALPRLQAGRSALGASVILGLIWGLWHLPLYFTRGHAASEGFFGWDLLGTVAVAILFTWVFNNTRGSLLLMLLFHASIAVAGLFLSTADAPLLNVVVQWVVVGLVVATAGSRHLSRQLEQGISKEEVNRHGS